MTVLHNDNRWDRSNVVFRDGRAVLFDWAGSRIAPLGSDLLGRSLRPLLFPVAADPIPPAQADGLGAF